MDTGNNNSLTSGGLTKGVFKLAGPMFVSSILQNAQSLIDLFWVGRLGSQAVAALGIGVTILMLLFPAAMGLSTGTVALVSQFAGAGKKEEASDVAGQSLVLGLIMGLVTGIIGWLFAGKMCLALGGTPELAKLGGEYLQIYFLGSFSIFILIMGNSILQGAGNTVIPMIALLIANLINIILDPILIFGLFGLPRLEIRGAAMAAVISDVNESVAYTFRNGTEYFAHRCADQRPVAGKNIDAGCVDQSCRVFRNCSNCRLQHRYADSSDIAYAGICPGECSGYHDGPEPWRRET